MQERYSGFAGDDPAGKAVIGAEVAVSPGDDAAEKLTVVLVVQEGLDWFWDCPFADSPAVGRDDEHELLIGHDLRFTGANRQSDTRLIELLYESVRVLRHVREVDESGHGSSKPRLRGRR